MGRDTQVYAMDHVAKMINETPELLDVAIGSDEDIIALTRRGIESLQEFIADVRTWPGGMRQFLIDEMCEPDIVEKIIANEPR